VALALVGLTLVLTIDWIARRIEHRRTIDEVEELKAS
jgi:hypothetical protein